MNLVKIPRYQLYLLQLENYELGRYLRLVFKKGLLPPKLGLRKNLVWTMKARALFACVFLSHLVLSAAVFYLFTRGFSILSIKYYVLSILFFAVLIPLYFIFYTLYSILLWPLDWLAKQVIIFRAKRRIKGLDGVKGGLTIIGIAGSYGKTTMKEVLRQVLSIKYQVLSTEESVNTPVGVARWILKNFTPSFAPTSRGTFSLKGEENIEVAIIEMGEHYQGDIIKLCKFTSPDVAVITGINEAHLERMGSMENITATIFEIAQGMKEGGVVMLNGDDKRVMENYEKYIKSAIKEQVYGSQQNSQFPISNFQFNAQNLKWQGDLGGLKIEIALLGEYAIMDCQAAAIIARVLGMSDQEIKEGIEKIRPVPHRLEPIQSPGGFLIIDDAYNGNSDGAREAIKVLDRFKDRRKIYITPGLVETGSASKQVHSEIGRQLASVADVVILIRNSVSGWIEEGVKSQESRVKSKEVEIIWFDTAPQAHAGLSKILKPNDVILFQNDWGDQYL